jgi:hypothetical protein
MWASTLLAIALVAIFFAPNQAIAQTFQQPAIGYGQFLTAGTPALAYFNGMLVLGYGNVSTGQLNIAFSTNGTNFSAIQQISASVGSAPAMVVNGGTLYVFYRNASDGTIYSVSSTNAVNFTPPVQIQTSGGSGPVPIFTSQPVTAANREGTIFVAYVNSTGIVQVVPTNGQTAGAPVAAASSNNLAISAPSITFFNNNLVVAYQASNHMLVMNSSPNGANWPTETTYPGVLMGSAPAVAPYDNSSLLVVFQSNDQFHVLFQVVGSSAQTMPASATTFYNNIRIGSAPSLAATPGFSSGFGVYTAFRSNDQFNFTFISKAQ